MSLMPTERGGGIGKEKEEVAYISKTSGPPHLMVLEISGVTMDLLRQGIHSYHQRSEYHCLRTERDSHVAAPGPGSRGGDGEILDSVEDRWRMSAEL